MLPNSLNPKVSIIIPVFNGTNYMSCAIDCALNQSYANKEIIVVNDGSSDDGATERLALSYGEKIRYISKENGGVSSALNCGIAYMTGDYFAWLSHDDLYSTTRIEDAVNLMVRHDMIGKKCIGLTGGYVMDAGGTRIKDLHHNFDNDRTYSGFEVLNVMVRSGVLYGCSLLIPRVAFDEAGGFDESLRYSQDALMWYRIFLAGYQLVSDDLPNVMSRMHGAQVSHTRRDLFSRDALVIAKELAEPMEKADPSGELLFRYTKRLARYECKEAICYLVNYMRANGSATFVRQATIQTSRLIGFFRYRIVKWVKFLLMWIRHK